MEKKVKVRIGKRKPHKHDYIRDSRNSKGQFKKGFTANPNGRPKDTSFMDEFRLALRTTEKKQRMTILEHFCAQAYTDNRVLTACVDRMLPALKSIEGAIATFETSMTDELAKAIQDKLKERFK